MRYLHTMLRVRDLDAALDFYCNKLGLKEVRRRVDEKNRYTLVFLAGPDDEGLVAESKKPRPRRAAGRAHLQLGHRGLRRGALFRPSRLSRSTISTRSATGCMKAGVTINRPPRDGQHGVRALARQALDRAAAEGRRPAAAGAVGVDAEHREMVSSPAAP